MYVFALYQHQPTTCECATRVTPAGTCVPSAAAALALVHTQGAAPWQALLAPSCMSVCIYVDWVQRVRSLSYFVFAVGFVAGFHLDPLHHRQAAERPCFCRPARACRVVICHIAAGQLYVGQARWHWARPVGCIRLCVCVCAVYAFTITGPAAQRCLDYVAAGGVGGGRVCACMRLYLCGERNSTC